MCRKNLPMIRLNLIAVKVINVDVKPFKPLAVKILTVSFFLQMVIYWHFSSEYQKQKSAVGLLKKQIAVMEVRKKEFLEMTPPEKINGLIQERNNWFKEREKMPVFILARLEKEIPPGVELKVFENGGGGGNIRLIAPDMDTATSYLNGVLGNKNVRVTMIDKVPTGILAACTWTE